MEDLEVGHEDLPEFYIRCAFLEDCPLGCVVVGGVFVEVAGADLADHCEGLHGEGEFELHVLVEVGGQDGGILVVEDQHVSIHEADVALVRNAGVDALDELDLAGRGGLDGVLEVDFLDHKEFPNQLA